MTIKRLTAVHKSVYKPSGGPTWPSLHIQKMLLPRFGEGNEGEDVSITDKARIIIQASTAAVRVLEHDESVTERETEKKTNLSVPLAGTVKNDRTVK